jgi:hypothetical protein
MLILKTLEAIAEDFALVLALCPLAMTSDENENVDEEMM